MAVIYFMWGRVGQITLLKFQKNETEEEFLQEKLECILNHIYGKKLTLQQSILELDDVCA